MTTHMSESAIERIINMDINLLYIESQSYSRGPCDSRIEKVFWDSWNESSSKYSLTTQHKVGGFRLDFAVPLSKYGVEIDGLAYHNGQESFINDRKRQRKLESQGWRIVRFAAKEVMADPIGCILETCDIFKQWDNEAGNHVTG